MRNRWWVTTGFAAAMLTLAACGGSSGSSGGAAPSTSAPSSQAASTTAAAKTMNIGGATVLANSKGFTLYWFAPDTSTASKCSGSCAKYWPPVKGPLTATGVAGTFGTITRSDGSVQATYNGHPLYTYIGDTAAGQAKGNGLNLSGGLWHEVTVSGSAAAPPASSSSSSGGGGYGY